MDQRPKCRAKYPSTKTSVYVCLADRRSLSSTASSLDATNSYTLDLFKRVDYIIRIYSSCCLPITHQPSLDPAKAPDPNLTNTTPVRRSVRSESLESLSGMSPTDCTTIMCRNVPPNLNKKDIIEKHFNRFGKVHKVFCRPAKNLAIIHFDDHVSWCNLFPLKHIYHALAILSLLTSSELVVNNYRPPSLVLRLLCYCSPLNMLL